MSYIYQDPSDLVFLSTNDKSQLPDFNILVKKLLFFKNIKITFRIIGESHFISIESTNHELHEILIGNYASLSNQCNFINLKKKLPFLFEDQKYSYKVSITKTKNEVLINFYPDFIEHYFESENNSSFKPVTKISWILDEKLNILKWQTIHSYLSDNKIIVINSTSEVNLSLLL